jgi:hypothetical protein
VLADAKIHFTRNRYLFGVRVSARSEETNIFAHVMAGVAQQTTRASQILPGTTGQQEVQVKSTDPALGIGMGIDLSAARHLSVRLVQVDYTPYRGNKVPLGSEKGWNHDYRLQVGLVFRWGLIK